VDQIIVRHSERWHCERETVSESQRGRGRRSTRGDILFFFQKKFWGRTCRGGKRETQNPELAGKKERKKKGESILLNPSSRDHAPEGRKRKATVRAEKRAKTAKKRPEAR